MFQLLFLIASFGATMLLVVPTTVKGIILTFALFVLGLALMIYKKLHKKLFRSWKQFMFLPLSLLASLQLGLGFYPSWSLSSKLKGLIGLFHLPATPTLLIGTFLLSALSSCFLYSFLPLLAKKISIIGQKHALTENLLTGFVASLTMVFLAQTSLNLNVLSMGLWYFLIGALVVWTVILFFYCLLGKMFPSIVISGSIFMVIVTVSTYVYRFRDRLLEPVDIFSVGTAMNVAENYSLFPIPFRLLIAWGIFLSLLIVLFFLLGKRKAGFSSKKRLALFTAFAVCVAFITFYTTTLKTYHWKKEGAVRYGYILDFVIKFKEISAPKPDNYNTDIIDLLAEQYKAGNSKLEKEPPHIIAIMDEAFSDLRVAGDFSTNREVTPFISSLKENTISGYALASVYGGNTANSEYEFLTGNSMAWLSPNTVPYQQYITSPSYSIVSYLSSSFDYHTIAMHPYLSSGWNRPLAYEYLGFDECSFIEAFPQKDFIRKYVSDREMVDFIINTYEAKKADPLFLFGVTMQNHGGYSYSGDHFTQHISLTDHTGQFPEVEQYLSLIYETDRAVEHLISYFQKVDEDVIIVFFGDHQPNIDTAFYEAISDTPLDTLDRQQDLYKVPFFIWANFDIDEGYLDCTSLNYLSTYVYEAAGLPLPPYNQFLQQMEALIPSINANGYYSLTSKRYLPVDEAVGEERTWLDLYHALQYHNSFDKANLNKALFPILD